MTWAQHIAFCFGALLHTGIIVQDVASSCQHVEETHDKSLVLLPFKKKQKNIKEYPTETPNEWAAVKIQMTPVYSTLRWNSLFPLDEQFPHDNPFPPALLRCITAALCRGFWVKLSSCFEISVTVIQPQLANAALSSKRLLWSLGIQPWLGTKTTLISDE